MENFAKNLKDCLRWKGITQTKLAKMLNVAKSTVSEWIKGTNSPNLERFNQICLILDETPNFFLGFKDY